MNENKSKNIPQVILAPLTGKAVPLSEVPDSVFSEKVLGDGVAIIPADGKIVSPVDGEIRGIYYEWTWISAKTGYGKYDEGMALLSKKPIARVQQFLTSKTDDYENWKTRRILGIQPEGSSDWFFTVHMGWWNDEEEPFVDQWKCIQETLKDPKYREGTIWLMGDFNSQDDVRTSNVICNGKNAPVVSDHYGVMITV